MEPTEDKQSLDPERWKLIKIVFAEACTLSGEDREAFLQSRCGSDAGLRAQVESLLAEHDAHPDFLETPAHALIDLSADDAPAQVGPYTILRLIGSGGMADVYLAERADGRFRKQVAIKVLKSDLGPGIQRRLEQE